MRGKVFPLSLMAVYLPLMGDSFGYPETQGDLIMSYVKAGELLDLAMEIAAQRYGMSYEAIDERSNAPSSNGRRRNTQRLIKALECVFGNKLTTSTNEVGGKTVHINGDTLRQIVDLAPEEMAALDHAIEMLAVANASNEASALQTLRTKIRLMASERRINSLDVDYEALLSGSYVMARPGPRPKIDPATMRPLTEAILALKQLAFDYTGSTGTAHRVVHPYGVIFGHRAYLVALVDGASGGNPSRWRIDRMANAQVLDAPSIRPIEFDLASYAKRSFGAFHNEQEYGEVEWRFRPSVASIVRGYRFHPDQEIIEEEDGSLTVRFEAGGHMEMAWALYAWGDSVEVIKPDAVRKLVQGYQRSDFSGVP